MIVVYSQTYVDELQNLKIQMYKFNINKRCDLKKKKKTHNGRIKTNQNVFNSDILTWLTGIT